jgi:hypothetical protein
VEATLTAYETVTVAVFVPLLYVEELAESGVYVAVKVSLPAASEPAGTVMTATPAFSVVEADV